MKRCIAGLAFALMLIRMLTAAAYAQEYQTVSQLRESVPARWTTTIETKWRDVAIDAEIVTPDVEAIPVVKVGYDLRLRSRRRKAAGRLLTIPTKRRAC